MLERMLNCHPDLVLWGEHGGLINNFVEIDEVARRFPPLVKPLPKRDLGGFIRNKQMGSFEPWRTSVSLEGLRGAARDWMLQTFSIGLTPEQRWGVKETFAMEERRSPSLC